MAAVEARTEEIKAEKDAKSTYVHHTLIDIETGYSTWIQWHTISSVYESS
jgi:hypothetical protein